MRGFAKFVMFTLLAIVVGIPLLMLVGVIGIPLLGVVAGLFGALLGIVGVFLKIGLFVVLPIVLVVALAKLLFGGR